MSKFDTKLTPEEFLREVNNLADFIRSAAVIDGRGKVYKAFLLAMKNGQAELDNVIFKHKEGSKFVQAYRKDTGEFLGSLGVSDDGMGLVVIPF